MPEEQKPKEEFVSLGDILHRPKFEELKKTIPVSPPAVLIPHTTHSSVAPVEIKPTINLEQKKLEPTTSDPLAIIATLIEHAAQTLHEAVTFLKQTSLQKKETIQNTSISETKKIFTHHTSPPRGTKIIGIFDGTSMNAGLKKYFVSPTSIQTLSLQNGDHLELTITPTGAFWYTKK